MFLKCIHCTFSFCAPNSYLILYLLMWRIWGAPNNASRRQLGFNSVFKGLILIQLTIFGLFHLIDLVLHFLCTENTNNLYHWTTYRFSVDAAHKNIWILHVSFAFLEHFSYKMPSIVILLHEHFFLNLGMILNIKLYYLFLSSSSCTALLRQKYQ